MLFPSVCSYVQALPYILFPFFSPDYLFAVTLLLLS